MSKLKYKLRNFFCPHRHREEVIDIRHYQLCLKSIREEIEKLKEMSKYGILGDSLWYKWRELHSEQSYYERRIRELKEKYHRP